MLGFSNIWTEKDVWPFLVYSLKSTCRQVLLTALKKEITQTISNTTLLNV